ncbi:hypothetical protein Bpfe_007240 [Biomphalaria pfeifferi]|uniref:Uncharacterized protein n=1 Tax=Biomphalaria pfeifferi TaxID=112525 RepID=A0AAD8BZ88_BIOPF|nr:hypothetical protein Bpfe_007240 [Biomphalaria pfeifferi]
MKDTVMLLLELLLTGVVIKIQPTKTQLLDHILKNVTVKNSLSLDNFYNQTADHVTSIDTLPEVPENVSSMSMLLKQQTTAGSDLPDSLNTSVGDQNQSLISTSALLVSPPTTQDSLTSDHPRTTSHSGQRVERSLLDPFLEDTIQHHQGLQETADDANEAEVSVSVSDGSSSVPYSEGDFLRFILDSDNDLVSKTSDVIGLSSADDIDDVIHLLSPNDVDDVLTDTSDDIDLAKLGDEHLISDVIHDILSNDKNMVESSSRPIHIFTPENNIAASNDIHVFTGGAQSFNLPFKINSLQNSDINMALNVLDEGSNNVAMDMLSNILKAPYHDNVGTPSLDTTYSKDMTMDSLHDDNENNVVLAIGDNDMMLNDISTPSLHHISVETYNNDIDNRHSLHVNDVLHSIESSESLLAEKLRSMLQQPSQHLDQIHYLPQNVNAYKSPGKQEWTRNSVYSLADNSMWTGENLLNLFGQQFDTSLLTRRENSQPLKMSPYISEPNNEIDKGELYLPVRTEIIKKSIGFNIPRDIRSENQYDINLIQKVPWLQLIKTPMKLSAISKVSPQNLAPTSGAGNVKGRLETSKPEYFQSVLSLVESLPFKEKEYISTKINYVLKMYRNIMDGKWRQLIPTTTKDIRMLAPRIQVLDLFNSNKTVTNNDIGEDTIHTNNLFTLILDLLKFGYNNSKAKLDKNNNYVTGDKKFEPSPFSRSESITEWPRINADESKLVKPSFRSKRSRDWPLGEVSSINHKFRNKKLFLTQQFQIMRHEKSQVSRQMAGVDNKMNQVLPWGISVQSEVQDLSEADSLEPPSLSLDSEEDKSDVINSKDTEPKFSHNEHTVARIKNQSEIIFSTNSTNITEENSLRSMVNETFSIETFPSNQTLKNLNLSHVETQTNSKNKRTLIDNIKREDKINDTNSSNKSFMNEKNTETIKTVTPGEEHVTKINTATRKPIGFVSVVSKSNNISSENSSIAKEKSLSLHNFNAALEGQNETDIQGNSSQMLRMFNDDQSKRNKRDLSGPVPLWLVHSTTKQSPTIRTAAHLQPITTKPSLRGQSSSQEQKYSNSQEQHAGNALISQSKLHDTRQAPPTKHTSSFNTDFVEIRPFENTRAHLSDSQPRPQDTPTTRSVDTKTTPEPYINRYLREKQNAEKLSGKRDLVKLKSSITKNQEVPKSKPANLNEHPAKMSSYPVFNSQHLQSFISDSQVGERSGASYSHKFVQSKSPFQPETQSTKSKDLTDKSQRDKHKVPSQNGINTGDLREAPVQQMSKSEPQDITSFEGGMLNMMPPEPVVVHYQPVITYYTPPIHYSQIPEYLDFTARLLTPQLPGLRDPSMNEAGLEKESQLKTDPDTDEPTMNDPDPDLSVSVKSADEDDLKVKVIEDIQSKYESSDDQKLSQTKQDSSQRTSLKEARTKDWKTGNSQKTYIPENNHWEEESSNTNYESQNRYQNTQSQTQKSQVPGYQQQNQRAWNKNRVPLNQEYYDTNLPAQNGNLGKNRNYATNYNTKNKVKWYDSSRFNQNNQQSPSILKSPTNEFEVLLRFTEPEKTNFKQSNVQDYSGSSNYYQTIDSSRGQGSSFNKQIPKVQTFSNEQDRDEEAVLEFVYSQKNMNLGQSGMTGSGGMDDSSSSNYYQIIDSSSDRAGQTGEDKMIDAVVEHYIYTNPKYGYKRTENKKD